MANRITAACDGASKGNPGPAAWGWVVADTEGAPDRWESGPLGTATNNVAELTALQKLLESTDPTVPMQVRMDSQYAMKAVTTWLPGWKKKGWKTTAGKPVANQSLVERIDTLLTGRTVEFMYVAAHQVDGDRLNAFADRAASHAARTQQQAGTAHGSAEPPAEPAVPARARRQSAPGQRSDVRESAAGAPRRGKTTLPVGCIPARYAGRCRCGRPYTAGEAIAKNPQGWGHPDCRVVEPA